MARLLFVVDETRQIEGSDLVLLPGIELRAGETFAAGNPIRLKRPDGSVLDWEIAAVTVFSRRPWRKHVCLITKGLSSADVPVGTEVWSVRGHLPTSVPEPKPFPRRVIVRVNHPRAEGLVIALRFGMTRKNDHFYTLILGPGGRAEVSGEDLLRKFDQACAMFIMDYDNPRGGFTGRVTPRVYSTAELRRAINEIEKYRRLVPKMRLMAIVNCNLKGFRQWREYISLPPEYEDKLRAALVRGQSSEEYNVEVELE